MKKAVFEDDNKSNLERMEELDAMINLDACPVCKSQMRKTGHEITEYSTKSFDSVLLIKCANEECGEWIVKGESIYQGSGVAESYNTFSVLKAQYETNRGKNFEQLGNSICFYALYK